MDRVLHWKEKWRQIDAAFHENTKTNSAQIVSDSLSFVVHFSTFIVCDWVELGGGAPPPPSRTNLEPVLDQ